MSYIHFFEISSEAARSIRERAINLPIQPMGPSAPLTGVPEPSRSGAARADYLLTLRELNRMIDEQLNLEMLMRNLQYGNATTRDYKQIKLFLSMMVMVTKSPRRHCDHGKHPKRLTLLLQLQNYPSTCITCNCRCC